MSEPRIIQLSAVTTEDGRVICMNKPAEVGWCSWLTGQGDTLQPPSRGTGTQFVLEWTTVEEKFFDMRFYEPVELDIGGGCWYGTWDHTDILGIDSIIPANNPVSTPGTGNVNLQSVPQGYNILIPAPLNDGSHTIDLNEAIPVECFKKEGYWDVDKNTGAVTPSDSPGEASWHLADAEIKNMLIHSLHVPPNHETPLNFASAWLHPKWITRVTVNKQSVGDGQFAMWVLMFRRSTFCDSP